MRFSQLFSKTLRQAPAEADSVSHQLLVRAGMIHQLVTGVYSYLPLGWRSLRKIEQIIREEMDSAGGQELMMPALLPLEMLQETGRDEAFGPGLFVLTDRRQRKLYLGPTHEEIITNLAKHNIQSYRDLPQLLYQIQTKFRDEPRPRGGLLRVREFTMKDLYSFDADEAGLDISYKKMIQAYHSVYRRCGLPVMMVEADSGAIGGKDSHEFIVITETGEDQVIYCQSCGYAANVERAQSVKPRGSGSDNLLPVEEVSTPGQKTIEEVATFLGVMPEQTLKAVFYVADGQVVFVTIRGDLGVNEIKLKNTLHCSELRLAMDGEVTGAGLVAGSASLVGIQGLRRIADDSITLGCNFVAGANKPYTHLKNTNYPRDFSVDLLVDIALAQPGQGCISCGQKLQITRGIEAGHVFKLGTAYSKLLGATFLDKQGVSQPTIMGCYGIGVGRLLAAVVECHHDDQGIIWPFSIAAYHIHICSLSGAEAAAEQLYLELTATGLEVLLDDRDESAGVKFNDADLLGLPVRLTLSKRTLKANSAEVKLRTAKEAQLWPLEGIASRLKELVHSQQQKQA